MTAGAFQNSNRRRAQLHPHCKLCNTGKKTKQTVCLTDAAFWDCVAESLSLHTAAVAQHS